MKIILRIFFSLSSTLLGFFVMANIGARFFVDKADGMAGGAMVLGYGLLGALVCLIASIVIGLKLSIPKLKLVSIISIVLASLAVLWMMANIKRQQQAQLDPESAYQGLAQYTLDVQQTRIVDPVLSTRHSIDTQKREWSTTLPDKRICVGTLSAKSHRTIEQALEKMINKHDSIQKNCSATANSSEKTMTWSYGGSKPGVKKGSIDISADCIAANPEIAQLLRNIALASSSSTSGVKCK